MADEPVMPADVAGLVKRLLLTPDCNVRQMSDNCVEAATVLKSQAAELAIMKEMYAREGAKALYELERAELAEAKLAEARKALADIRSEAIRCRGEDGWRSIETAPKDGSIIILTNGREVFAGAWGARIKGDGFPWLLVEDVSTHQPHGCCDMEDDERIEVNGWPATTPTHWMPLPIPPVNQSEWRDESTQFNAR